MILMEGSSSSPGPRRNNNNNKNNGWGRKARSLVGNTMGGVRGRTNWASWAVAGTLAYFLWIKPSQQLKKEQEERAAALAASAASDPYRYVEKRKPIPDPQETGLQYGHKNRAKSE